MIKKIVSSLSKIHSRIREKDKSRSRSPSWDKVRDAHLECHPVCAACGASDNLQVHHIIPYRVEASRELDPSNLITLCMGKHDCHLHVGHGGSFKYYNPNVISDALLFSASFFKRRDKLIAEIKKRRQKF